MNLLCEIFYKGLTIFSSTNFIRRGGDFEDDVNYALVNELNNITITGNSWKTEVDNQCNPNSSNKRVDLHTSLPFPIMIETKIIEQYSLRGANHIFPYLFCGFSCRFYGDNVCTQDCQFLNNPTSSQYNFMLNSCKYKQEGQIFKDIEKMFEFEATGLSSCFKDSLKINFIYILQPHDSPFTLSHKDLRQKIESIFDNVRIRNNYSFQFSKILTIYDNDIGIQDVKNKKK